MHVIARILSSSKHRLLTLGLCFISESDRPYTDPPVEVSYQGTRFIHDTLFDLMGWVFSVAGTIPRDAEPANFYLPLTALFAHFCLVQHPHFIPETVHATWFTQNGVKRMVLGASLLLPSILQYESPTAVSNTRDRFDHLSIMYEYEVLRRDRKSQLQRILQLMDAGLIDVVRGRFERYGRCAETWPWVYINS